MRPRARNGVNHTKCPKDFQQGTMTTDLLKQKMPKHTDHPQKGPKSEKKHKKQTLIGFYLVSNKKMTIFVAELGCKSHFFCNLQPI